jgi:hypothetical protein
MNAAATVPRIQSITQSNIQINERKFFHYAPNDDKIYHITCQIIQQGSVSLDDYNYDHGFFYNINPTANYYVTCKIFSHSLIVNILNKNIYGIDSGINNLERKELLSLNQRLDLERDLKQVLPFHLTQNHISEREVRTNSVQNLNPSYGRNIQYGHNTQIIDSQTNFDNSYPQQTGVGYYTNNVTINPRQQVNFNNIPQNVPRGPGYNGNTNSFRGDIGNSVMTTQAISITDSQNNGFPLSSSTSTAPQNEVVYHVTNSQQIIDFNNIPQNITGKEMRLNDYRNTNSFHENIVDNTLATQSISNTNISQNYDNERQRVVCTQQQVDLNNNYRSTAVMITQANDLTCDHPNINDIQQVDINDSYGDKDLHNGNTGNNVTITQANNLTCDHQDINDTHQVSQPQRQVDLNDNYGDTDSHNVMTTQANDLTCDHQDINDIQQRQQ